MKRIIQMLALGVIVALVVAGVAIAAVEYEKEHEAKATLSLDQAINLVTDKYPGQVVGTEREKEDGQVVYEITVAGDNGRNREFTVNAQSGRVTEGTEEGE